MFSLWQRVGYDSTVELSSTVSTTVSRCVSLTDIKREALAKLAAALTQHRAQIRRETSQRFHLLRLGFLLKIPRYEVGSLAAPDQRGESISGEDASAAHSAESFARALH